MIANTRITNARLAALKPGQTIWDSLAGFGARRQKGTAISFIVMYRVEGRQRFHTIGRYGHLTPDQARKEAQRILGQAATGGDPSGEKQEQRKAMTVAELCEVYLKDATDGRLLTRRRQPKRASTLLIDRGRIERHIVPLIGKLKVTAVTRQDVEGMLHDIAEGKTACRVKTGPRGLTRVRGGKGAATRAVRLLGGIFSYAMDKGLRTDNPCRSVAKFEDGQRDRHLSTAEYRKLGTGLVLAEQQAMWPPAVQAAKFLALTGWRSGEVLALRWNEIDLDRRTVILGDTKTGRSVRPLSEAACDLLRGLNHTGAVLVFPPSRGDHDVIMTGRFFRKIVKLSALPADVTPHVLRHSFASVAADLGFSDLTIGALLGHKGRTITSRYAHGSDAVLLAAADKVAERIMALLSHQEQQAAA